MHVIGRFLVGVGIAVMAFAFLGGGGREIMGAVEPAAADRPATHNMLVVGEETIYLSHLPMFQEEGKSPMPHRYQVILEATFAKQEVYVQDRRAHPATTIYTLNPENFILSELFPSDPQHPRRGTFKAKAIFRGHLERDDRVTILQDVEVSVKRVIYAREFDPKAQKPPHLEYLLFGRGQNLFMAHLIATPPDFDQILAVQISDHDLTTEEMAQGVPIVFPGTTNAADSRLRAEQQRVKATQVAPAQPSKTLQVGVNKELYFEEGELQVPPEFNTTAAEKQADFP